MMTRVACTKSNKNMSENQKLLSGTLETLILKSLTISRMHGYSIANHIRQNSSGNLIIEEGSLYPALHRLERKGWVSAEWGMSANNRRAKYYRITSAGRKQLKTKTAIWLQFVESINCVLKPSTTKQLSKDKRT